MALRFTLSATNLQLSDITVTNVVAPNTEATALDFTLSASQLQLSNAEIIAGWVAPTVDVSMANLVAAAIVAARMEAADIWLNANPKDRAFIEVPELVDQLAYSLSRIQSDVADLSDTTAIALSTGFSDATSLFDAATLALNLGPIDEVAFAETLAFVIQAVLQDTVTTQEQHAIALTRPATDSTAVSEQHQLSVSRPVTDTFGTADTNYWTVSKALLDAASPTDATSLITSKSESDSFAVGDSLQTLLGKGLSDASTPSDTIERMVQFQRAFTDVVSIDDFSQVDKQWSGTKQNVAFTSDSAQMILGQTHSDSALIDDAYAYAASKALYDSVGFSDAVSIQLNSGSTPVFNGFTFNSSTFG
jgi:hypothetical protein